ncbi:MAG: flagellar hook-associated protein FlgK [Oscillospiraceae bacterium]|nr:flagellar hook-associated protein FlgK [Oscillospiraceae bacterium]
MRSTFFGLEIGRTGLMVSQKGLDVSGHNAANVDTIGYTRQRLITTAYEPYSVLHQFRPVENGLVGAGARVMILDQVRSKYLDRQLRSEVTLQQYWTNRTEALTYVETLFEANDSSSVTNALTAFFSAMNTETLEANDGEQRIVLQQAGRTLASAFNLLRERLVELQQNQNNSIPLLTKRINEIADSLATLNKNIYAYELNGELALDLRDKRNLLLDELSEYIDIEYEESADNKMTVWLGGGKDDDNMLISHLHIRRLGTEDLDGNPLTRTDPITGVEVYTPRWVEEVIKDINGRDIRVKAINPDPVGTDDGIELAMRNGKLKSYIDMAWSSEKTLNPGIPYFIMQLDNLARSLVQEMNAIHSAGYTHPAATGGSQTGINFFWDADVDTNGDGVIDINDVNAGNLRLSDEVNEDYYMIAASDRQVLNPGDPGYDGTVTDVGNQENIKAMYRLRLSNILQALGVQQYNPDGTPNGTADISIGNFFSFMSALTTEVASVLKHSKEVEAVENIQVLNAENLRISVSGVSLDEEMTNLLKYQHAYAGSSRVITTMDEALETLINKMGLVGR